MNTTNLTTLSLDGIINSTTVGPVSADSIPSWLQWFKPVIDFYSDKHNLANYFVIPLMILVYVGSAIVYVIGMMIEFFDFKIQVFRNKRLGLPPPKRKKVKKPNIFQRAKAKMVQIEQKRTEEKEKKIEEKQKKKEEVIQQQEALQVKMMDEFDRMKYLNNYYATLNSEKQAAHKKEAAKRQEMQKVWGGNFAKAYASAFLQLNTDSDLTGVELRPATARPQTRASSRASTMSPDVTDLWTMAQIARLEKKREEKMRIQELEREGKRSKWRRLPKNKVKKDKDEFLSLHDHESQF